MPSRSAFDSAEKYYSTLFHELTHSTGHPSRVGREGIMEHNPFGSEDYSKEELVAEMGAAMLCGVAGVESRTLDNSASYLQSWINRLRSDSRLIVSAASQAQKAADYILARTAVDTERQPATALDSRRAASRTQLNDPANSDPAIRYERRKRTLDP
jgi:antirestriction protein ArdC